MKCLFTNLSLTAQDYQSTLLIDREGEHLGIKRLMSIKTLKIWHQEAMSRRNDKEGKGMGVNESKLSKFKSSLPVWG